jgi:hypothetical protein
MTPKSTGDMRGTATGGHVLLKHGLMTEREGAGHKKAKASSGMAGADEHAAHEKHKMQSDATFAQRAALGGVSLIALLVGMAAPANWVNLRLSAREVGGAIMPPGMIKDRDTPAAAMRDMAAVDPRLVTPRYGIDVKGGRPLEPRDDLSRPSRHWRDTPRRSPP